MKLIAPLLSLLSISLAASPCYAQTEERFTLRGALALAQPLANDGIGFEATFGVAIPVLPHLAIDVLGGSGASGTDENGRGWARLAIGARGSWTFDRIVPYVAVRFSHIHDASRKSWNEHFAENALGDPSYGLIHTSALGGAIGVSAHFGRDRRWSLFAEFEGNGVIHAHEAADNAGGGSSDPPSGWLSLCVGTQVAPW